MFYDLDPNTTYEFQARTVRMNSDGTETRSAWTAKDTATTPALYNLIEVDSTEKLNAIRKIERHPLRP